MFRKNNIFNIKSLSDRFYQSTTANKATLIGLLKDLTPDYSYACVKNQSAYSDESIL